MQLANNNLSTAAQQMLPKKMFPPVKKKNVGMCVKNVDLVKTLVFS